MGNIADMSTDSIVLPANRWLKEGYGSSKAIFAKAGRWELQKACDTIVKQNGKLDITDAYPTPGFKANASVIIHAVVPKWIDGQSDEYVSLLLTYRNALATADELGCQSIAFPLLAAGNNGFDLALALDVAQTVIKDYKATNKLKDVSLILYDQRAIEMVKHQGNKIKIVPIDSAAKGGFFKKPNLKKEDLIKNAQFAFDIYKNVKRFCKDNPEIVILAKGVVANLIAKKNNNH